MACNKCQRYDNKLKVQNPEMTPIKVKETLELVGMDVIGSYRSTPQTYVLCYNCHLYVAV